ncbi:MAG: hypothetical protein NVSMB45_11980 [Ginsengibacter sp.]
MRNQVVEKIRFKSNAIIVCGFSKGANDIIHHNFLDCTYTPVCSPCSTGFKVNDEGGASHSQFTSFAKKSC